jgi:uncharacterized protein YndB with AHSA1/START domain
MITIQDSVEIKAPPKEVFEWFAHLDKNFQAWHPKDHKVCRYIKGNLLEEGSILDFEVYLLGKLQKARFYVTKVVPNSRIEYKMGFPFSLFGAGGAFTIESKNSGSIFTQDVFMGTNSPLFKGITDAIINLIFKRINEDYERHVIEEDRNLKELIEKKVK